MELLLFTGTVLEISILTENYLSSNVTVSVYVSLNGYLKKYSFRSKFEISSNPNSNFKIIPSQKVLIDQDVLIENFEEIGTITVYVDGKLDGIRKLPLVRTTNLTQSFHDQLGITIILTKPKFRMRCRARKIDETYDIESFC